MKAILAFFLLGALTTSDCFEYKTPAIGSTGEVLVIADSDTWNTASEALREALERIIYTPQAEPVFYLRRILPDELERYHRYRNLVFMASLNSNSATTDLINQMLSDDARRGVMNGDHFMFSRSDEWARDQLLMLLVGPNDEAIRDNITNEADWVYRQFETNLQTALESRMFRRLEEKDIEKDLWERFGWTMRIEYDYRLALANAANKFVWLRKYDPQRMIFVHWIDAPDGDRITSDWLLEQRNHLGYTYCDSMIVDDKYLTSRDVEFAGFDAVQLQGLWKIPHKTVGGPFICTAFYDDITDRIFIIDAAVFAPGREKLPWLQRTQTVARNFSLRPFDHFE
jgi:hypothetical protein